MIQRSIDFNMLRSGLDNYFHCLFCTCSTWYFLFLFVYISFSVCTVVGRTQDEYNMCRRPNSTHWDRYWSADDQHTARRRRTVRVQLKKSFPGRGFELDEIWRHITSGSVFPLIFVENVLVVCWWIRWSSFLTVLGSCCELSTLGRKSHENDTESEESLWLGPIRHFD
jgi:hypothetical protein